jgi:peptide chain release factor subunit 1
MKMLLTYQDIEEICRCKNEKGAISLYLYSPVHDTRAEFAIRLNNLEDVIKAEADKVITKRKDIKVLLRNFTDAQRALRKSFVKNKAQTCCAFVSGDFFKCATIPVRLRNRAVVDEEFYTLPLVVLLEQFDRFAVLVFDRRSARLFSYYLGQLQQEKLIFHDYVLPKLNASTCSWKGLSEKTINHRIQDSFHRHLKEVGRFVFDCFKPLGFDKLLLASPRTEIDTIKKHLHSYLNTRLAGEFRANVDDDMEIIGEKAAKVVAGYRREKEKNKISELFDGIAQKRAALGANAVLEALSAGSVRELICTDDFHTSGYVCPQRHFFTVTPTTGLKCIHCGRVLRRRAFLEDEIIDEAFAQRAEIFHIFYEKHSLQQHGIAAFLRFPVSRNNIGEVKRVNLMSKSSVPIHPLC